MKLVTLFAQHSTAQHSTAQHSTAQHSTAQHSTARLTFNRISTALFITFSTFTVLSAQAEELPLGIATGTNSFAIGQNSFTTAANGIAVGTEAVAIGGEKTQEEFVEAKNKQQDLINTIQTHRNTISTHDRAIFEKQNEITLKATELSVYERNKRELVDKKNQKAQFESRKTEKETALTEKQAAVNAANEAANKVKNGDKFITFYDMLVNLDWQANKEYSTLAGELKTKVDDAFGDTFSQYNNEKYEDIIRLYQRKYGETQGKYDRLEHDVKAMIAPLTVQETSHGNYLSYFYVRISPFLNEGERNFDYLTDSSYLTDFNYEYRSRGEEPLPNIEDDLNAYIDSVGTLGRASNNTLSNSTFVTIAPRFSSDFQRYSNLTRRAFNSYLLQISSATKALSENKFNALFTSLSDHRGNDTGYFSTNAARPFVYNFDPDFLEKFDRAIYENYSLVKQVRFAFKKKGSEIDKVAPLGFDFALKVIDKLKSKNERFAEDDFRVFSSAYNYLTKTYKDSIDWEYTESAIDLDDYKPKLERVITYYDKINELMELLKKVKDFAYNGESQDKIDELNKTIAEKQRIILAEADNTENYLAYIKINYTEYARKYLEYGKDEADKLIHRLNTELNIYNPEDVLIKGVDTEIARLKQNYDDAVREKNTITTEIENITAEIKKLNKELEKEQEVSDLIAQKEREKAALEAEKTALEDKKSEVETALEKAKTDLANSDFNRLGGENSYAQGFQAFASGDNAIAIGTQAQAIKHGSIALGNQAKALGFRSVAIGESAVALSNNSVALGAGSYAIRGAISQPYDAPIGNGRTARTPTGTVGEVSVGRTKEDGSQELRQITHVAAGTADTDAVNVWQLKKAIESVGGGSFDPEQLYVLNRRIDGVESRLKQGVANAVAVASLPQAIHPSQHALSVGTGNYLGATSVAIGYSRVSDNGRFMIKFNGSVSNKGAYTTGAGVGIFW